MQRMHKNNETFARFRLCTPPKNVLKPIELEQRPAAALQYLMGDALDGLMRGFGPGQPGTRTAGVYPPGGASVFGGQRRPSAGAANNRGRPRVGSANQQMANMLPVGGGFGAPSQRAPMVASHGRNAIGGGGGAGVLGTNAYGAQPAPKQWMANPATMVMTGHGAGSVAQGLARGGAAPHLGANSSAAPAATSNLTGSSAAMTSSPPMQHGFASEQNARWRKYMEDMYTAEHGFASRPGSLYAAVYDGHGGRTAVEFVTSHLHTQLERELRAAPNAPIADLMKSAFLKIDKMLLQMGTHNCGTTAAVCLCLRATGTGATGPITVHMANTGDSRALLIPEAPHPVVRLSIDHVATDPTEVARVIADGGHVVNNRVGGTLAVTRALGDHCLKQVGVLGGAVGCSAEPHYVQRVIAPQDKFLLMASDGVWDVMSDADAQELCLQNAHETCDAISNIVIQNALARGTRDNLSCLVVKLK